MEPGELASPWLIYCDLTLAGVWQLLSEGNIDCEAKIQYNCRTRSRTSLTPLRGGVLESPLSAVHGKC